MKNILLITMGIVLGYFAPSFAKSSAPDTIVTQKLEIQSKDGKKQIVMGTSGENSPGIWLFDANGKVRLNIGLYGDGNAMVVLNDSNEQAVQIVRTVGPQHAAHLILKNAGRDRMIMGLNPTHFEPFLVYFDSAGVKKTVYGNY